MAKKKTPDVVLVPLVTIDIDEPHRRRGVDVGALQAATREEIRRSSAAKLGA